MADLFTEACLDKIACIAVGVAALAGGGAGVASAIGAGQLAAQGGIGLGAMAAARAVAGRARADVTARKVFEQTVSDTRLILERAGASDSARLAHVASQFEMFLSLVEFPVVDLAKMLRDSTTGETFADGLAATMVKQLTYSVGADLRDPLDARLAHEILSESVRAGVASSQTIQLEIILELTRKAVQDVELLRADLAQEALATRQAINIAAAAKR